MTEKNVAQYEEFIDCQVSEDEGLIFIKVIAMPYQDPVEFNTAEARAFAEKILDGVKKIEERFGK
ncbi:hypothetical protein [Duganella hordei]|uniref:hypothetical protein n=1 Tax=Duganella hordei TaxID=2865934 RepID=UPI0030E8105A